MKKIVCDFCGKEPGDPFNIDNLCEITFKKKKGWEYIIGKTQELEVCESCLNDFIRQKRQS